MYKLKKKLIDFQLQKMMTLNYQSQLVKFFIVIWHI